MNILICDDMQREIDRLTSLLDKPGFDRLSAYAVNTVGFTSGVDALAYVRSGKMVDVCFLDIVMPEMSGIDLAKALRRDGFKSEIVFLSTSKEYGPETYLVKAFGYLLKPPTPDAVRKILAGIENARKAVDTDGIKVKEKGAVRSLLYRDISYAEVVNHKVFYWLTDGKNVEVTATFGETAPQLLRDKRFVQCHNSFIVNMNEVSSIIGREVITRGGARLPLSRSFSDLKKVFLDRGLE